MSRYSCEGVVNVTCFHEDNKLLICESFSIEEAISETTKYFGLRSVVSKGQFPLYLSNLGSWIQRPRRASIAMDKRGEALTEGVLFRLTFTTTKYAVAPVAPVEPLSHVFLHSNISFQYSPLSERVLTGQSYHETKRCQMQKE